MSEEEKRDGAGGPSQESEKPDPVSLPEAKVQEGAARQQADRADPAPLDPGVPSAGEGESAPVRRKETDEEKAARRKAAFEAREAAKVAAAQAAGRPAASAPAAGNASAAPASPAPGQGAQAAASPAPASPPQADAAATPPGEPAAEAAPPPPSPNQPRLERVAVLLRELVAPDAVADAAINEPDDHMPTLVIPPEHWPAAARLFRDHAELAINYLRNVSGVDHETHLEVVYHLLSLSIGHNYAVKVRTDRDHPRVPSATPVWETANWPEREIYDLLGVDFPGHPDLRRIMMSDDWVGHPLRKDYEPFDPEV